MNDEWWMHVWILKLAIKLIVALYTRFKVLVKLNLNLLLDGVERGGVQLGTLNKSWSTHNRMELKGWGKSERWGKSWIISEKIYI